MICTTKLFDELESTHFLHYVNTCKDYFKFKIYLKYCDDDSICNYYDDSKQNSCSPYLK